MDKNSIQQMLIDLSKAKVARAEIAAGYDSMVDRITPPEIKAEIASIKAEKDGQLLLADSRIEELTSKIKESTLALGETVGVPGVGSAVYCKGRVSWNTDGLDGLMVAVPELAQFRKQGEPYIQLK